MSPYQTRRDTVVRYGVVGVARLKLMRGLPAVAALLGHEDQSVRLAVAQSLVAFGPAAKPYLPALERAFSVESDGIARKTIEGAIKAIRATK